VRLRQHGRTEVMFPDDPSTPPSRLLLAPLFPYSLSLSLESCPSSSPAPLFLPAAASFSRFTLLLCLSPSLHLTYFAFPPFSLSFFRVLFRVRRCSKARRDLKFREIRGSIRSHTWRQFSSAIAPSSDTRLRVRSSLSLPLRVIPSFSSTCEISRYFTPERTYVRDVPDSRPVHFSRVFRMGLSFLVAAITYRYEFHELSAVSHHHSPCHLSETPARARAHACVRVVSLFSALFFPLSLSLSLSLLCFSVALYAPPTFRFSSGSR